MRSTVFLVAFSTMSVLACGGKDTVGPGTGNGTPTVASVVVTPGNATLVSLGETVQLTASAQDASGNTISGKTFTWSSSDESLAIVSSSGLVTAVANGSATITATTDGVNGTAAVTVDAFTFATISAGGEPYTCGVAASDEAYCWGRNAVGQLGDGTTTQRLTATPVAGGLTFQSVSAGGSHTCGITTTGDAYCWGYNGNGKLGDGTQQSRLTPTAVSGGLAFQSISAGFGHSCGVTTQGTAYCWGRNREGELGDGTATNSSVPVRVSDPT